MPAAIPLIGAAFSVTAGLTGALAGTLAGGLMVAGGALAGVGALTGNKKLTMLGAVLGLGGGLVNMANGAAGAASVTDVAASEAASNGVFTNDAAAANGLDAASQTASQTAAAAGDMVGGSAADQALTGSSASKWGLDNNPAGRGLVSDAMDPSQAYGAESGWNKDVTQAATAQPAADAGVKPSSKWGTDNNPAGRAAPAAPAAPGGTESWWDKFSKTAGGAVDWAKANPELVKTGAGLVQGAMQSYGQEQLAESNMNRTKRYQDWVRQRYSDSVRNLQVPAAVLRPGQTPGIIAATRT